MQVGREPWARHASSSAAVGSLAARSLGQQRKGTEGRRLAHNFPGSLAPLPSCPATQSHQGPDSPGIRRPAPRTGARPWAPGCRALGRPPGHSASSLRCRQPRGLSRPSESWEASPTECSLPQSPRAPRGRKKTPSCSSFWLIKWIFLWAFWWNSLFLASKSSARGLDLLRDQPLETTNPGEAGASLGVGLEGSHPRAAGREGPPRARLGPWGPA